jgi:large subunit ribosomal protein L31
MSSTPGSLSEASDSFTEGEFPQMKHPELYNVHVACATCGTSFDLRTTAAALAVDVCSNCHPAYTGAERAVVSGSRIERFNRRSALAAA